METHDVAHSLGALKEIPEDLVEGLRALGALGKNEIGYGKRLAGGVSSDIWRIDLPNGRTVCLKRALVRLKVAALWEAPIERNSFEADWFRTAGAIEPDAVPTLIAELPNTGAFVMSYLDPSNHPVWKELLRTGDATPQVAAQIGRRLAHIHAATAGRADIAERFATDHIFHQIRVEPYLLATAKVHVDRADAIHALADSVMTSKKTLVHGDVSPKNILIGPKGPVFIDAECAWYGEPAFDLAFCLNHLLLKCLWTHHAVQGFLRCFSALARTYLALVDWENPAELDARTARLLPGLMLGRIDGKSPVEYITDELDKDRVRRVARALLSNPVDTVEKVAATWNKETSV